MPLRSMIDLSTQEFARDAEAMRVLGKHELALTFAPPSHSFGRRSAAQNGACRLSIIRGRVGGTVCDGVELAEVE